jgi:hypothetical protein
LNARHAPKCDVAPEPRQASEENLDDGGLHYVQPQGHLLLFLLSKKPAVSLFLSVVIYSPGEEEEEEVEKSDSACCCPEEEEENPPSALVAVVRLVLLRLRLLIMLLFFSSFYGCTLAPPPAEGEALDALPFVRIGIGEGAGFGCRSSIALRMIVVIDAKARIFHPLLSSFNCRFHLL